MCKKLVVRAWVDGRERDEFRHLVFEVCLAGRHDAAKELSEAVKAGRSWDVETCQGRLSKLISSGQRSTVYYYSSDRYDVKFSWQSDREGGFGRWYSFCLTGMSMDEESIAVLGRITRILGKADALGQYYAKPYQVWEALKAAGAIYGEWLPGASVIVEAEVPECLLPPVIVEAEAA
jgi:hypothetical protein